jgi:hypothetical protein
VQAPVKVRKLEVVVDEIGPSLPWAQANVKRISDQRSDEIAAGEARSDVSA